MLPSNNLFYTWINSLYFVYDDRFAIIVQKKILLMVRLLTWLDMNVIFHVLPASRHRCSQPIYTQTSVCRRAANYSGDLLSYLRTFTSCGPGKAAGRTTQRITKVARNARRPTFAGLRHLQEVLSAVAEGLRSRCLRSRLRLSTTWWKLVLGTTSLLFNTQSVNVV